MRQFPRFPNQMLLRVRPFFFNRCLALLLLLLPVKALLATPCAITHNRWVDTYLEGLDGLQRLDMTLAHVREGALLSEKVIETLARKIADESHRMDTLANHLEGQNGAILVRWSRSLNDFQFLLSALRQNQLKNIISLKVVEQSRTVEELIETINERLAVLIAGRYRNATKFEKDPIGYWFTKELNVHERALQMHLRRSIAEHLVEKAHIDQVLPLGTNARWYFEQLLQSDENQALTWSILLRPVTLSHVELPKTTLFELLGFAVEKDPVGFRHVRAELETHLFDGTAGDGTFYALHVFKYLSERRQQKGYRFYLEVAFKPEGYQGPMLPRADVMAISPAGKVELIEVKSRLADGDGATKMKRQFSRYIEQVGTETAIVGVEGIKSVNVTRLRVIHDSAHLPGWVDRLMDGHHAVQERVSWEPRPSRRPRR